MWICELTNAVVEVRVPELLHVLCTACILGRITHIKYLHGTSANSPFLTMRPWFLFNCLYTWKGTLSQCRFWHNELLSSLKNLLNHKYQCPLSKWFEQKLSRMETSYLIIIFACGKALMHMHMHMLTVCNFSSPNEIIPYILISWIIIHMITLHNSILPIMGFGWRVFSTKKKLKKLLAIPTWWKTAKIDDSIFFHSPRMCFCIIFYLALSFCLFFFSLSNGKRTFGIYFCCCFLLHSFLFPSLQRIIVWDRYIIGL